MKKRVLVIGATGLVAKPVARKLQADGYIVRVLSRDSEKAKKIFPEGFEIAEGDVLSGQGTKEAFEGVSLVFIALPDRDVPAGMTNIIDQSKASGVEHIAHISGSSVRKENAIHPMIISHLEGERLLTESDIPYSIFKLTMILDTLPRYANKGKAMIIGDQPHKWNWIHTEDVARMVSKAFSSKDARNKKFTIFGPDAYTMAEAIDKFNDKFYPGAKKAKPTPFWMMKILGFFIGKDLRYAVTLFQYFSTHSQEGDPAEANRILGKPEIGLEKFFQKYKEEELNVAK